MGVFWEINTLCSVQLPYTTNIFFLRILLAYIVLVSLAQAGRQAGSVWSSLLTSQSVSQSVREETTKLEGGEEKKSEAEEY